MATVQNKGQEKITALYCRLSVEDVKEGADKENDSNSIKNQKQILSDYAKSHGYHNIRFFVDDGISGTSFDREQFEVMEQMVEAGEIGTIIVKDLSRFGREHVEMGRLTQFVYPSLGVTFIAIQENVNTATGEGVEMMPFHNIFNEWFAAQTSKKIRAVWKSKADHGKRISSSVPYGYVKDEADFEKWHIDPEAAEVVKHIFQLCLSGLGPMQIAKQLEREKVLVPTAYHHAKGRKVSNPLPADPYQWPVNTIKHILANRQYTGCAVNFISTTVSYKVHKTVYNDPEDWQIIPDMQDAIIDEDTWMRVQELRSHRRRLTATGRKSLFSGLVYCPDCGSKLYFCAAKSVKRNQEFFVCSNYKSGRGSCSIHFIRDVALEQIVLAAISDLADFVRCYEPVFLYMMEEKDNAMQMAEQARMRRTVAEGKKRITELDTLISRIYEDNVLGKISDERFAKLSAGYEQEQKDLQAAVSRAETALQEAEQKKTDLRTLLKALREFTDVKELTPEMVNTLIRRIEVHSPEQKWGRGKVKVDIYFTAVGLIDLPTEKEIKKMMEKALAQHPSKTA